MKFTAVSWKQKNKTKIIGQLTIGVDKWGCLSKVVISVLSAELPDQFRYVLYQTWARKD